MFRVALLGACGLGLSLARLREDGESVGASPHGWSASDSIGKVIEYAYDGYSSPLPTLPMSSFRRFEEVH